MQRHMMSQDVVAPLRKRVTLFATAISQRTQPSRLSMNLRPGTARLCWLMVLAFHVANALYALALAFVYHFLKRPDMDYYVKLLQLMPQKNYTWIVALYASVSSVNFYSALQMILCTLYYRRVAYGRHRSAATVASETTNPKAGRLWKAWLDKPHQTLGFLRGLFAAISVRGQLFDAVLLVREIVEVASQAYQASSASFFVSTVWINQLYGVLLFLNCIANTAVYVFKREETGVRRFLCTAIDLFLDFAWSSVLPTRIALTYLPTFIAHAYSFPQEFVYSDTAFLHAILDFRQLFLVSWADTVTTLLPYLNMFFGLRNLKILLHHEAVDAMQSFSSNTTSPRDVASKSTSIQSLKSESVVPEPAATAPVSRHSNSIHVAPVTPEGPPSIDLGGIKRRKPAAEPTYRGRSSYLMYTLHALMPLSGVFILLTSIHASGAFQSHNQLCNAGCKLRVRPWFATHCACSVLELNCVHDAISGTESEVQRIFATLDARTLNSLIITHCPQLVVPSEIRRFSMLLYLEFYNVTLVQWTQEASLSLPYMPRLGNVFFERSRLPGGIPEGLTHDLAPNIIDIEFITTMLGNGNDYGIPADLAAKWPSVVMLYFEHCGLQEFPRVLASMALTDLSLVDNNISHIPEDLDANHAWMYLYLDRNPITKLPENFGDMSQLEMLSFQHTQVAELPAWFWALPLASVFLYANDTPLCTNGKLSAVERSAAGIRCSKENKNIANGIFSLQIKDELRRLP